ncbi:plasmid mobilization protein [Pseudogemmobacter faecipullorum]|uniref:plasmid mobilization protein n=1 Tax=Pseudogemmobacter faecipullorum TaxID=2755041 RepID=UPI003F49A8E2
MSERITSKPRSARRQRNDVLQFRASEAEAQRARRRARQAGMSLSAYLRSSSLNPSALPQGTVLQLANLCDQLHMVLERQDGREAMSWQLCTELRQRLQALSAE